MSNKTGVPERLSPEYHAHIRSPKWKAFRDTVIFKRGAACVLCKKDDELAEPDVHHMTYERFGDEREEDVIVVCRTCHDTIHASQRDALSARRAKGWVWTWDERVNAWAMKVYGADWRRWVSRDVAESRFKRWLRQKGEA